MTDGLQQSFVGMWATEMYLKWKLCVIREMKK